MAFVFFILVAAADEDAMSLDASFSLEGWTTKVSCLLQKSRNMFIENSDTIGSLEVLLLNTYIHHRCIQEIRSFFPFIQNELYSELQGWEFDVRKVYDGATADNLSLSNMTETLLSGQLQRISSAMRDVFADCTTTFGLAGTTSSNLISNHFSHGGESMSRSSSRNDDRDHKSVYSEANMLHFDDEIIADVWETFNAQIMLALRTFYQSLSLETEFTKELETFLHESFFAVFVAGIHELQRFNWKRWWDKRDFLLTTIDRSAIHGMVAAAEDLIYAPIFSIGTAAAVRGGEDVEEAKRGKEGEEGDEVGEEKETEEEKQQREKEASQQATLNIHYDENDRISCTESLIGLVQNASYRVDWQALQSFYKDDSEQT